jgi:hypothetical protein
MREKVAGKMTRRRKVKFRNMQEANVTTKGREGGSGAPYGNGGVTRNTS